MTTNPPLEEDRLAAALGVPELAPTAPAYRTPPHNPDAEKALLGAILTNNRAHEKVSEFLRAEHFSDPANCLIYDACTRLIERGQIADPVTLKSFFSQTDALSKVGGAQYLAELAGAAVTIINAGEYGRIVFDLYLKREMIALGEDIVNDAYSPDIDKPANQQIESAEQHLFNLATQGEYEGGFQDFKTSIIEAVHMAEVAHKREGALAGVTTGLRDLDQMLGGLHPSDLLILAGRPSMGKTALVTNIAYNAAYSHFRSGGEEGAVVGFFSLEMSAEQLAARILSEQTEISSDKMRKGELANEEFTRLVVASQELHRIPIFIDDTPALTVSALRTRARRLKRQHNLGLIVVDYLQLISPPPGKNDGRVNEVSEITRGLKTLAKELGVPVIALSQLSRAVESRDPPRPQLSDLRESGSIEQDADVVMFIYREEYYLERKKPAQRADDDGAKFADREAKWEEAMDRVRNLAQVIVAKQRHGPIGDVTLMFQGQFTRFGDLDRQHFQE
ncbi:replicative DNA helicase [Varunaivibrio sulfuroxidans]|uniref:Replicative DNA helicase n=1 Tax=Varunaivibrio sulfuroxidans TaxID=1773489 RepID=A0A4R3J4L5_9PROT|nr:replicative DNA helicase [Varunaivibrio sulfuroxidans]TCS60134.1 replicative DNA helicase [Varunaivibrio sulfuroxidans]WES30894.1 replicative DNA helicase [Varunaivibrio sulfuroxidans]